MGGRQDVQNGTRRPLGPPIMPWGKWQVSAVEVLEGDVCGPSEGKTGDHM